MGVVGWRFDLASSHAIQKLNEQLGTDDLHQNLVNPTGIWITQASLKRIESKNKIDCSMKTGQVQSGTMRRYTRFRPTGLLSPGAMPRREAFGRPGPWLKR